MLKIKKHDKKKIRHSVFSKMIPCIIFTWKAVQLHFIF